MDSREGWRSERREGEGTRTRMSIQNQIQWVEIHLESESRRHLTCGVLPVNPTSNSSALNAAPR